MRNDRSDREFPVPAGGLGRLLRIGGMTSGILGGAVSQGVRQMARGTRPNLQQTLLTPGTARRVTQDLGRMRGAAMKLGQMLSIDSGIVLPPEMTSILSALQSDAPHMPPRQLRTVLDQEWGKGWRGGFNRFDVRPFASASIGQVHRAQSRNGHEMAIKVQYPGVRASIDSDINNLAMLLRVPGVVPRGTDLAPLLEKARQQLHQEADYAAEARNLNSFRSLLSENSAFRLPDLHPDRSTPRILAMSFVRSQPVDALMNAPQDRRDGFVRHLIDLVLKELFVFRLMQTDPNLANYGYCPEHDAVVLLDFGAVMEIRPDLARDFRRLLNAGLENNPVETRAAMERTGYFNAQTSPRHQAIIQTMFETAMAPLRQSDPFDFGTAGLPERLRDIGMALEAERDLTHVPPAETLFLHRKIGGIYLLATKLRARVALRPIVERYR